MNHSCRPRAAFLFLMTSMIQCESCMRRAQDMRSTGQHLYVSNVLTQVSFTACALPEARPAFRNAHLIFALSLPSPLSGANFTSFAAAMAAGPRASGGCLGQYGAWRAWDALGSV